MMKLKDKSDMAISKCGQFFTAQGQHIGPIYQHLSLIGSIERAEHMQQGAFSTTGGTHNSGYLAFLNLNAESPQYFEVSVTLINGCTD